MYPALPSPPLFQRVPVILCTRHIHSHHSVSTCSFSSMHPAHPFPPLCFNVFLSFYVPGTSIFTTLFQRVPFFYAPGTSIRTTLFQHVPVILCTRHIHPRHSVSTCSCHSMHPAHPSPPLCFNVFLFFYAPGTSIPTTLFQRVPFLLCTRHIHPHHSVSTCSCPMHPAHPSPPFCFNVFLSFYAPGTSVPTTLFQRVPVILCTRHIHPHHSVSTCSCHSMHPAHPSPPFCFNVFLFFYAPGTFIPTTLFQRVHVLCTRHIHPHHSVSTCSCHSMHPAHPSPPLCFNVFLSFYAHGTSVPTTLFQRVPVILCTRHIHPHHSVSTCSCHSMHPAHSSPPLCFNVFMSYAPGTSIPTILFQRVPVLLCTRHIRPHHSVSTCSCHSMHPAHPYPLLCFNVFLSFYSPGTSVPTTLFQRVPVILFTRHIHPHHSVSTCSCHSMHPAHPSPSVSTCSCHSLYPLLCFTRPSIHPAHPSPPLCFNVFLSFHSVSTCSCHSMHPAHPSPPLCFNVFMSFYAPGTSIPTTLFQRVHVILCTRHIHPHHSVSTCSCPSIHPAHPSPPLCFNVFMSFHAPGTSIPTTLFQRVHVILCTRHIHPHHSVSTCSCHSMHPAHPSPPLCFNVFMSFYAPGTSIPITLFQRVPVILCTRHIHPTTLFQRVPVLLCARHIHPHHSVSTCSCPSMHPAHPSPPLCFNVFLSFYSPGTSVPTTLFQRVHVILCTRHIHPHHSVSTCSCHSMHPAHPSHHSVSTCSCPSMHPAHPSPPLCFNVFLSFYAPGTSIPTTLFQRVPVILCTRHIHSHHSVSTCSFSSMHPAHPSPPLCFNVFLSFYVPGTSISTTLFQRVPFFLCTRHIHLHHSVSTCSFSSMHPAYPSPPLCFNVFLSFYVPGTSISTTRFQRVPFLLCTRHIHPHHSVSTCSFSSMHPAHPSPPLCFNVFLSFFAPGTSIPTTLFQRVPVILCTRHIHLHHSVSTCSFSSMHPAHPSPPLCFNVFLFFYAPGTSISTTLFQRVPVLLCTRHIHPHHSVSTCSCHSMLPAHPSAPLCFNLFLSFYVPGTSIRATLFQCVHVILCTRHIHPHHSVSTCSCRMHPAHPSPPFCFNVFLSFYAPGTSVPTTLFQRVPVILCTRHIHTHYSVSTCSCPSIHPAHPSPPLCFNVFLPFYSPGTSIPTTLFQRVPVILCTRHIRPHHSVSTCSCHSMHPAHPYPLLCFNVFLSFYSPGTSVPTTLFQRVPVILCTRHIHPHHSVSTCSCHSMHPAHPSPPLCSNVFMSFYAPGTSIPTTLFQRVHVILCTRHIHPHHSVSTCSCPSIHPAHPSPPLCFNVFMSFYAPGTSIPTTLFQRVHVILCTRHIHPTTLFQRVHVILCTRHIHPHHSVSTRSCHSMHPAHPSHHSVSTCSCHSMHPAHPSPPLCFNVVVSSYAPGTSIPTTLFQRGPVILCTRHIHPHHSVPTCSCPSMHPAHPSPHSMHPAHPSPPLCFNVFMSFYAPVTSIPTTLFQRVPVLLCTSHIHPHHSVSTCSCPSIHPAHPSPPLWSCHDIITCPYHSGPVMISLHVPTTLVLS